MSSDSPLDRCFRSRRHFRSPWVRATAQLKAIVAGRWKPLSSSIVKWRALGQRSDGCAPSALISYQLDSVRPGDRSIVCLDRPHLRSFRVDQCCSASDTTLASVRGLSPPTAKKGYGCPLWRLTPRTVAGTAAAPAKSEQALQQVQADQTSLSGRQTQQNQMGLSGQPTAPATEALFRS